MTTTKKICAITMARNDAFFLEHWIAYYGAILGKENLYIYLDGTDQPIPPTAGEATVVHCERIPGQVVAAERRRLTHLSNMASELLKKIRPCNRHRRRRISGIGPQCRRVVGIVP